MLSAWHLQYIQVQWGTILRSRNGNWTSHRSPSSTGEWPADRVGRAKPSGFQCKGAHCRQGKEVVGIVLHFPQTHTNLLKSEKSPGCCNLSWRHGEVLKAEITKKPVFLHRTRQKIYPDTWKFLCPCKRVFRPSFICFLPGKATHFYKDTLSKGCQCVN